MKKECFKCNKKLNIENFYKHSQMPDGHVNKCKECNKKDIRENYKKNIEKKQEHDQYRNRYSIQRIFSRKYSKMKSKSIKPQTGGRVYKIMGQEILSKEDWYKWCYEEKNYKKFMKIYNNWVQSGFNQKLVPSIDRINNDKTYEVGNLQWLTLSENIIKYTH